MGMRLPASPCLASPSMSTHLQSPQPGRVHARPAELSCLSFSYAPPAPSPSGRTQPAVVPSGSACLCLLGVAACSFSAQLLLNRGFQLELAARASAFNYTQVIWANVLGVLCFHEPLTLPTVLGAVLIGAGVLTVSADKRPAADAAAAAAAAEGGEPRTEAAAEAGAQLKGKGGSGSGGLQSQEEGWALGSASAAPAAASVQLQPLQAERPHGSTADPAL